MMIDLVLYRCRIGVYAGGSFRGDIMKRSSQESSIFLPYCPKSTKFYHMDKSTMHTEELTVHSQQYFINTKISCLLYIYLIMFFTLLSLLVVHSISLSASQIIILGGLGVPYLNWTMSLPYYCAHKGCILLPYILYYTKSYL